MEVFISYSNTNKRVAGKIQKILNAFGVKSFLAHEDIKVSLDWQTVILDHLSKSDLFIALLSKAYEESFWCIQESGVAVFQNMTLILLSLDGTIPKGFLGKTQSVRIDEKSLSISDLIPGIIQHDFAFGTELIIDTIGNSRSFRQAEKNFELILPYINRLKKTQIKELLKRSARNRQVYDAILCRSQYIPGILKDYGHLLSKKDLSVFIEDTRQK
ncbi:toll/interleukin-1 receptor domain-containing protein [Leptospira sp. WS92.C1]